MAIARNKWNLGEGRNFQEGPHKERAVLIGVVQPPQSEEKVIEYLDELEFLAQPPERICKAIYPEDGQAGFQDLYR